MSGVTPADQSEARFSAATASYLKTFGEDRRAAKRKSLAISAGGCFAYSLVCCLLPALLLFFLGYQVRNDWNESATKTQCTVVSTKVYENTCYKWWGKGTAAYTCFDGYATLSWLDSDGQEKQKEMLIMNEDSERDVINDLEHGYPQGSKVDCWFNDNQGSDLRLEPYDAGICLGFSITFMVLAAAAIGVWIFFAYQSVKDGSDIFEIC